MHRFIMLLPSKLHKGVVENSFSPIYVLLFYVAADFLNDGNSFLVIPFEADSADGSGRVRTNLHLFEMTLEDRDGVFHFHLEMGPMFPDIPGKVVSTALEYCDARYKLWFINTFDGERSEIRCESLQGDLQGTHHTSTRTFIGLYFDLFLRYKNWFMMTSDRCTSENELKSPIHIFVACVQHGMWKPWMIDLMNSYQQMLLKTR